jgi:hypothetical protein
MCYVLCHDCQTTVRRYLGLNNPHELGCDSALKLTLLAVERRVNLLLKVLPNLLSYNLVQGNISFVPLHKKYGDGEGRGLLGRFDA